MTIKRTNNPNNETSTSESTDFERLLNESFGKSERRLSTGDRVKAEVLSVGKENVIVSTGTRFDGFVPAAQLLDSEGLCRVKVGDWIELFVTYVKGSQVFLSPNPTALNLAEGIQDAFAQGLAVEGRVEAVNKGGFDVSIFGKNAFCPISQMDTKRIEKPEEYLGKKFQFKVTQMGEGGRNIVVSRRKLLDETQGVAMASFKDQTRVGDVLKGQVTRLESFGAFVEIAPGVEGLAHISELAWTRVGHPKDVLTVGQSVTATVIKVEGEERRLKISLSLKSNDNNPWNQLPAEISQGRVVSGKVLRCMPFGAFVELKPGVEGLVPLSELSSKRVAKTEEAVNVGDQVNVLIKDINLAARRISLSIRGAQEEAASASESQDIREYQASEKARVASSASLGDLGSKLQAALSKQTKKN